MSLPFDPSLTRTNAASILLKEPVTDSKATRDWIRMVVANSSPTVPFDARVALIFRLDCSPQSEAIRIQLLADASTGPEAMVLSRLALETFGRPRTERGHETLKAVLSGDDYIGQVHAIKWLSGNTRRDVPLALASYAARTEVPEALRCEALKAISVGRHDDAAVEAVIKIATGDGSEAVRRQALSLKGAGRYTNYADLLAGKLDSCLASISEVDHKAQLHSIAEINNLLECLNDTLSEKALTSIDGLLKFLIKETAARSAWTQTSYLQPSDLPILPACNVLASNPSEQATLRLLSLCESEDCRNLPHIKEHLRQLICARKDPLVPTFASVLVEAGLRDPVNNDLIQTGLRGLVNNWGPEDEAGLLMWLKAKDSRELVLRELQKLDGSVSQGAGAHQRYIKLPLFDDSRSRQALLALLPELAPRSSDFRNERLEYYASGPIGRFRCLLSMLGPIRDAREKSLVDAAINRGEKAWSLARPLAHQALSIIDDCLLKDSTILKGSNLREFLAIKIGARQ